MDYKIQTLSDVRYYTKILSDARYTAYTKAESDAKYALMTVDAYTKAESDTKYALKATPIRKIRVMPITIHKTTSKTTFTPWQQ